MEHLFLALLMLRDYKESMNKELHILTIKGTHSKCTRANFIAGMESRGTTVQFAQSRLGDFEIVKVNGHAVARAFKTAFDLMAFMAR